MRPSGALPVGYLEPYVRRFTSVEFTQRLDLILFHHHAPNGRKALDDLFRLWFTNGIPGSVQELKLFSHYKDDCLIMAALQTNLVSEQSAQFLRPIRVISLTSIVIDWQSLAFHELVDLRLDSMVDEVFPSITQMSAILVACPNLETLKLSRMTIMSNNLPYPQPVHLLHLKSLNFRGLRPRVLDILLPLIVPGSRDIGLSISVRKVDFLSEALLNFFQRTKVTTLFAYGLKQSQWFSQVMPVLPYLEYLALNAAVLDHDLDLTLQRSILGQISSTSPPILGLRRFYRLSCQCDPGTLSRLRATGIIRRILSWNSKSTINGDEITSLDFADTLGNTSENASEINIITSQQSHPYLGWPCLD
ncbi:hypothetical protein BDV93DRAFT_558826 [Ceratobasidium sp. AG-I]|nr:hypothetical protein BDV93DRAFT_558826 [Ceratobasidium sp. AG-I]